MKIKGDAGQAMDLPPLASSRACSPRTQSRLSDEPYGPRLETSRHKQHDDDNQDNAEDADAAIAKTIAVTSEAAAKAAEQKDDQYDDEYESKRHVAVLSRLACGRNLQIGGYPMWSGNSDLRVRQSQANEIKPHGPHAT